MENMKSEKRKQVVSIIVPAFNEASILETNLLRLCDYMKSLAGEYDWELIVVNDGSSDATGEIADNFAKTISNVKVIHHVVNLNLGQALRTGFANSRGDYVIVLDIDLSYSPDHIEQLLKTIHDTKAQVIVASPYMKGGKVSNVPTLRKVLSKWANKFLSFFNPHIDLHTITGMVRAYDGKFLRSMDLKAMGVEINAEIVYKTQLLRGRIIEVPAHLDWGIQKAAQTGRISNFRVVKGIFAYIISGFMFRPFMFFFLPGFFILLLSLYPLSWAFIHTNKELGKVPDHVEFFFSRLSAAIGEAFKAFPHTFFIAGVALIVGIQLMSLGLLAFQKKNYFEELFHIGTSIYRKSQE